MKELNVNKTLSEFGERVSKLSKINLGILKKDSSKRLRKSIGYKVIESKNSFEFSMLMEDYGEWVDKGRKAGKGVPKGVIEKWTKQKPVKLRDKGGKFKEKTEANIKSAAYLINRKIKEKGIKPTNFLSDPFEDEFKKLPDDLIESFGLDAMSLLDHSLNKLNKEYK